MNDNCERPIEIGIENDNQTIPSCNDCTATSVTTRIPSRESGRVLGLRVQPSEKKQGVAEKTVLLYFMNLASGHVLSSFSDYE